MLDSGQLSACIMDMDGVVTDTARLHARAWKRMFDTFLAHYSRDQEDRQPPFDIDRDYRRYVDGKPRYAGVQSFLESRDISLPYGKSTDDPDQETVCGLGNRKNGYFLALVDEEGVKPFASAVRFIKQGRQAGLRFALISASRNARRILSAAGLTELFQVVIDGVRAAEEKLAGKPQPDIFLAAAAGLGVEAGAAAVIEDALAGGAALPLSSA